MSCDEPRRNDAAFRAQNDEHATTIRRVAHAFDEPGAAQAFDEIQRRARLQQEVRGEAARRNARGSGALDRKQRLVRVGAGAGRRLVVAGAGAAVLLAGTSDSCGCAAVSRLASAISLLSDVS